MTWAGFVPKPALVAEALLPVWDEAVGSIAGVGAVVRRSAVSEVVAFGVDTGEIAQFERFRFPVQAT